MTFKQILWDIYLERVGQKKYWSIFKLEMVIINTNSTFTIEIESK